MRLSWTFRVLAAACAAAFVAVPATASAPAEGPAPTVVCLNTVLAALPAMPQIGDPAPVGTIRSTTGPGAPTATIPNVVLLAPQPGTGALTVSVGTTLPSLPGVTLIAPQVLIPPTPAPGQIPSVVASGLLRSAAGAAATASVACY
jgi:hypothetical protein